MAFNEFDGVSSKTLKQEIRDILRTMDERTHEVLYYYECGEERFSVNVDCFLSDLYARECELKEELARRLTASGALHEKEVN